MATEKAALMVSKFTTMLSKLLSVAKAGGKPLVFEAVVMTANSTRDYNLQALFANHALYDMSSCRVTCKVLDETGGSDTETYFIDPGTDVIGGVKAPGSARIKLVSATSRTVQIRIDPPVKKL